MELSMDSGTHFSLTIYKNVVGSCLEEWVLVTNSWDNKTGWLYTKIPYLFGAVANHRHWLTWAEFAVGRSCSRIRVSKMIGDRWSVIDDRWSVIDDRRRSFPPPIVCHSLLWPNSVSVLFQLTLKTVIYINGEGTKITSSVNTLSYRFVLLYSN